MIYTFIVDPFPGLEKCQTGEGENSALLRDFLVVDLDHVQPKIVKVVMMRVQNLVQSPTHLAILSSCNERK